MATTAVPESAELRDQCAALRLELKAWEKEFSAGNAGRKAGREDIKTNVDIAAKYKEYNRLRDVLAGKQPELALTRTPKKKQQRKPVTTDAGGAQFQTPSKRRTAAASAHVSPNLPQDDRDGAISAFQVSTPSALRTFVGPTPQHNGVVIGLFDHLSPIAVRTPSRTTGRSVLMPVDGNVAQTPRKAPIGQDKIEEEENAPTSGGRASRTPMSSGKRFMLDQFATPMKRKRGDTADGVESQGGFSAVFPTPSTERKCRSTPVFLRRDTQSFDVTCADAGGAQQRAPWKKKGLVRSLSNMIRAMKKEEEDRRDEELEAMRELEMAPGGPPEKRQTPKPNDEVTLVHDSQAVEMRLGPDMPNTGEDGDDDDDDADVAGETGMPRKAWKKKGLKRQTKRVIMRPVKTLPKPQAAVQVDASDEEGEPDEKATENEADFMPSTAAADSAGEFEDSAEDSDYGNDLSQTLRKRRKTRKDDKSNGAKTTSKACNDAKKDEQKKKKGRTINANAQSHANYRRLKIKGKNSRQGGGRFGRSRR